MQLIAIESSNLRLMFMVHREPDDIHAGCVQLYLFKLK